MSDPITVRRSPEYWAIADHTKNKTVAEKIRGGIADYTNRNGCPPKYCLCNIADAAEAELEEIELLPRTYVQRNVFYLGQEPWE